MLFKKYNFLPVPFNCLTSNVTYLYCIQSILNLAKVDGIGDLPPKIPIIPVVQDKLNVSRLNLYSKLIRPPFHYRRVTL